MLERFPGYLHAILAGVTTACDPAARHAEDSCGDAIHEGELGQVIRQPCLQNPCHGGTWGGRWLEDSSAQGRGGKWGGG